MFDKIKELQQFDHFKPKAPYYNGYELLSKLDKNRQKPEILVSTSNRSAGKSTFFNAYNVHDFLQREHWFAIMVRTQEEIGENVAPYWASIGDLYFPELNMIQRKGAKGLYDTLLIGRKDDETGESYVQCGFVLALSAAEKIKKNSTLFHKIYRLYCDEWFTESNWYNKNELLWFQSIRKSIARGGGAQTRFLQILIVGNLISIHNPYYEEWGICDSLQLNTKFLRMDGLVLEQGFNAAAAEADKASAFSRVFANSDYNKQTQEKSYLIDESQFIDNSVCDVGLYILTIDYKQKSYSVRYNEMGGFYYVSNTPDPSRILHHAATVEDISGNTIYDKKNRYRVLLKDMLHKNSVRFKNVSARDAFYHYIMGK